MISLSKSRLQGRNECTVTMGVERTNIEYRSGSREIGSGVKFRLADLRTAIDQTQARSIC